MKWIACFSGQGAQKEGMLKELYDEFDVVRKKFNLASDIFALDFEELLFNTDQDTLNLTKYTQPLILVSSLAIFDIFKQKNELPDAVAGFSIGEFSALHAAGCIDFKEVCEIVKVRANAMHEASLEADASMLAIKKPDIDKINNILKDYLSKEAWISNYNSPNQIVISVKNNVKDNVMDILWGSNFTVIPVEVSGPFHTPLMEPARLKLEEYLNAIDFKEASIPVFSNLDGQPSTDSDLLKQKVISQTSSPVKWLDSVHNMVDVSDIFIECGPGKTLSKFIKNINPNTVQLQTDSIENLNKTFNFIS